MAKPDRLIYLALGGAGEIGMNMYLYGYGPEGAERFILVDMGVSFPTMESTPGVDLIMADPAWIQARADRLEAIFITHGHEDHVGALGLLWHRLKKPVHARRFTAALAKSKMERAGQPTDAVRQEAPWPHVVHAGPFSVGFLPIAHSIPESSALVIDTPAGRVFHSADFKSDPTPLVGEPFDAQALRGLGDEGVKVLACDSTNVFNPHPGRSEAVLTEPIERLIREAEGLVVATTFASNVARLKTLAEAGRAAGRAVVVLGRAMNTMLKTAHAAEVLDGFPETLDVLDIDTVPRRHLMVLATGSQGERRAASAQLAQGSYMGLELRPGRHLPLLLEDHPRQRGRGRPHPQPALGEGRHRGRRVGRPLPRLGARQPPRPRDPAGAAAAADAGADARRAPPPRRPRGAGRRARHRRGGGAERHACST